MCRALAQGGRRCPAHSNPNQLRARSIRQRIGRYTRRLDAAEAACASAVTSGDETKIEGAAAAVDKWERLARKALTESENLTLPPEPPATRAHEYTAATTADWTEDQLADAYVENERDPLAREAINGLLVERWNASQPYADPGATPQAWQPHESEEGQEHAADTAVLPSRCRRRLTADEQLRETYDAYTTTQWLAAEADCRGFLLSKEGQAAGIDPEELFSGPAARAEKYASDELKEWWGRNGRMSFAAFKANAYESDPDADKAQTQRDRDNRAALYRARTHDWW